MQTKTMQNLVVGTERMLYQSAGTDVQVYAQDVLIDKLNQAFIRCFEAKFWPQFYTRITRTLDGVTGNPVTPFSTITTWEDVDRVFRRNSQVPIPHMPQSYNLLDIPTGNTVRFIQAAPGALLFTAYPLTAVDDLVVSGRARPVNAGDFGLLDIVPFDFMALQYHAAWEYMVDDASNPAMAAKFEALFSSRMKQLEEISFPDFVLLAPNSTAIPTEWR